MSAADPEARRSSAEPPCPCATGCRGGSLFPGGPGNTEKDPVRFGTLMDDLERKVFGPLPDTTWIYPGHGLDTTLGAERASVPEWRARGW